MKTITAQEIKRRGISAVDDDLKDGPVHVIKNNKLQYVVLDEERYSNLIREQEASYTTRLDQALTDLEKGETQSFNNPDDLLEAIDKSDQ